MIRILIVALCLAAIRHCLVKWRAVGMVEGVWSALGMLIWLPAAGADSSPASQRAMVYIYVGPESAMDDRYRYHWLVLREALEKTVPKYGPYRMDAAGYMNEERQAFELQHQTGKLTVLIRGDTLEYARIFEAVWIPVDKGLLGYRVFLIRGEDQRQFTRSTSLDDLRNFSIGQGNGWKDIDILRANGLKVTPGGDYAGLFPMLVNRRFDLFSRGVEEVLDEYERQKKQYPDLAIEQNLILHYPIARYFWFAKSDEGRRLAQRVQEGMTMMVEDGSLDRLFVACHEKLLDQLHLGTRTLFMLNNPFAGSKAQVDDKRLWYLPQEEKAPAAETTSRPAKAP